MIGKKTFAQFNKKSTTLVISRYPEKRLGKESTDGISWYTKRTILAQSARYKTKFVILAEKGRSNRPRLYGDDRVLVLRIFDKKHPSLFPQILRWLKIFSKVKRVIVHSEFCADGGGKNIMLLLPFLLMIKLSGREIIFFSHNVVENFDEIGEHLNIAKNSLKLKIYNKGIKFYNQMLGKIVDKIVVLDKALEERLKKYVDCKKIISTNIWVEKAKDLISKEEARKRLGFKKNEKIILYFGFVSWYKGADWLIKEFEKYIRKNKKERIRLVVAGGQAYSLKNKKYYQRYYQDLKRRIENSKQMNLTGFVLEEDIKLYFRACDLAVLPYRGLIGASGTLNHALSYGKAFMLSKKMEKALGNGEIKGKLKTIKIDRENFVFEHNKKKGMEKIISTLKNSREIKKLERLSEEIALVYGFKNSIKNEYNKIYANLVKKENSEFTKTNSKSS